jgi:hypothetical protein
MELFKASEVCNRLGITTWTLTNWYQWERISLEDGSLSARCLPVPIKAEGVKGKPRMWTENQIEELRAFQNNIVKGRNGIMARVTNPKSRHAKHD